MRIRNRTATGMLASVTLAGGCAVYFFARPASFYAVAAPATFPAWTAALPSFLHTLAFALLCASIPGLYRRAWHGALAWGGIALLTEAAQRGPQHWGILSRGTFDWRDVAAIGCATLVAVAIARTGMQRR